MELIEVIGYFGALIIGFVLGLIGGGGSILTVPILVYLLHMDPVTSTAYSLFIVGTSSFIGTIQNMRKKMIDYKAALVFSIPALIVVYFTRKSLIPAIPDELFYVDDFLVTKDIAIMLFFGIIMLLASLSMIRGKCMNCDDVEDLALTYNIPVIIFQAVIVGLVSGLVGAGGGFLIIPALVILVKLPMKKAVATSLMIITINSLIGFTGDVQNLEIDWTFLMTFTLMSILGMIIGVYLNKYIQGSKLKKGFGWFVLFMGTYILFKEIIQ